MMGSILSNKYFLGTIHRPKIPPKNSSKCLLWLIVCRSYCHRHSLLLTHPPYSLKKRLLKLSANFVCPLSLSAFRTTSHSVHKCIAFVRDSRYCVFFYSSLLCYLVFPAVTVFTIFTRTQSSQFHNHWQDQNANTTAMFPCTQLSCQPV